MKDYVHARLGKEERNLLKELKKATGETETALVKKGLRLVYQREIGVKKNALEVAGDLVGCVKGGPPDLSTNKKYMEGYGE